MILGYWVNSLSSVQRRKHWPQNQKSQMLNLTYMKTADEHFFIKYWVILHMIFFSFSPWVPWWQTQFIVHVTQFIVHGTPFIVHITPFIVFVTPLNFIVLTFCLRLVCYEESLKCVTKCPISTVFYWVLQSKFKDQIHL